MVHRKLNYTEFHSFKFSIKINLITLLDFNLSSIKFVQPHKN